MYYSKNEQSIVKTFYEHLNMIGKNDILSLVWNSGTVNCAFDTCFDDCDEDNESDEFTSFVFKKIDIIGNPPIEITADNCFIINYHNFPEKILLNGNKVN